MAILVLRCRWCSEPYSCDDSRIGQLHRCESCQKDTPVRECSLNFACPQCDEPLGVSKKFIDVPFDCPSCGHGILIDSSDADTPTESDQPEVKQQAEQSPLDEPEMDFVCPSCKTELSAPVSMLGEILDCPSCSSPVQIPVSKRKVKKEPNAYQRHSGSTATSMNHASSALNSVNRPRGRQKSRAPLLTTIVLCLFVVGFGTTWYMAQPETHADSRKLSGDELCELGIAALNQRDNRKAFECFSAGAESGHALCQYNLGAVYIDGIGISLNYGMAVAWYSKAAHQGLPVAQKKLGLCYFRGVGVDKDLSKAVYWFGQAADQGDQEAQQALDELLYEDSRIRGAQKSPPDRDAAERFLTHAADTIVQLKINNGELKDAHRVGFGFQYVKGNPKCDANAEVRYEFKFYTRSGMLRRNVGHLFFYHDPTKSDWFNSEINIDGSPQYGR
jgi:Zn-finger nucleic acid-binding protein